MKKINTRKLVESAMLIAVGTVLSMIKFDMPMGGGITLVSMLPLILLSHRYGWKWGLVSAFVYSALQLVLGLDNVRYATGFGMAVAIIMLDYVVAYTVIGLSGIFDKTMGKGLPAVAVGIAVTFVLRFICHFITGVWIWDAMWPNDYGMTSYIYSLVYNGWYMGAELVITEIVALLIYKPLGKYFRGEDLTK